MEEFTELHPRDRETLKAAIGDLSSDTPRTELAAYRYTEILKKAGRGVREALTSIMTDIATEAAKKLLFGNGG